MKEFTLAPCAAHMSIFVLLWVISIATSQQIPDSQSLVIDELEHLLVDNGGKNDAAFFSGVTPCSTYFDSSTGLFDNTLGRQTSSQWIRVAFRKPFLSSSLFDPLCLISCFFYQRTGKVDRYPDTYLEGHDFRHTRVQSFKPRDQSHINHYDSNWKFGTEHSLKFKISEKFITDVLLAMGYIWTENYKMSCSKFSNRQIPHMAILERRL